MSTSRLYATALAAAVFATLAAAGVGAESGKADAARPELVVNAPVYADNVDADNATYPQYADNVDADNAAYPMYADNVDADNAARAAEAAELTAKAGRVPTF